MWNSLESIPEAPSANNSVRWGEVTGQADTVIIVASGPSLMRFPFMRLKGKGFVIAVNDAHRSVPFADRWVSVDTIRLSARFPVTFNEKGYVAAPADFGRADAVFNCDRFPPPLGLQCLLRIDQLGLAENPKHLSGFNSAFGALNFAYHLKPKRIVLFGVDGNHLSRYFYGLRRRVSQRADDQMRKMPELFASAVAQLKARGIEVINASRTSAISCFRKMSPVEALRLMGG